MMFDDIKMESTECKQLFKKFPIGERSIVSVYGFTILDIKSMFSTGVTH